MGTFIFNLNYLPNFFSNKHFLENSIEYWFVVFFLDNKFSLIGVCYRIYLGIGDKSTHKNRFLLVLLVIISSFYNNKFFPFKK